MKIIYIGFFDERFKYKVELNGHTFDYFTGCGHCYVAKTAGKQSPLDIPFGQASDHFLKTVLRRRSLSFNERVYIKFPKDEDVLECLRTDVECGTMSFYEFCDNFGYDKDSISALSIHMLCMKTADQLRGFKFEDN
jgi:hypothetical protein